MWGKLQLFSLVMSFALYIVDVGSDVYVAIQHLENGDELFFTITLSFVGLSIILLNIYATTVLQAPPVVRVFAFICHFSMICLFISEIRRWKKESFGSDEAYPCENPCERKEHFSKCDCAVCKERLRKSVRASLNMSHVRSIETFCESVPQWLLQVYVMIYKQSYPWYAIVSVALSFMSLVLSIYSLEKNYWMLKIVNDRDNYIRPVSFPKRSAVVFVVWQSLLLLGRLSAIMLNVLVFSGSIGVIIFWHAMMVNVALLISISKWEGCGTFCWRLCGMFALSFVIIYPLLFHASHSSVAVMKKFIPGIKRISKRFKKVAVIFVPLLFFIFHCVAGSIAIAALEKDELIAPYAVIAGLYVLAFVFEAIYYGSCHPLDVTYNKWKKLRARADLVRGTINMSDQLHPVY